MPKATLADRVMPDDVVTLTRRTDSERAAYVQGYTAAVAACLHLMAKWFFMSNKDARACRDEMKALTQFLGDGNG